MARQKPSKAERNRRTTITACILASLVFWLSIKLSDSYTAEEVISISYSLPQGLAFAQEPPVMLTASVRATGWELMRQSFKRKERLIKIDSADLANNPDGIIGVRQAVAGAFADEGLKVDAMTNERIVLKMEQVGTKRVPLRLIASIEYKTGFAGVGSPRLTPDSVTLTGPQSILDSLMFWPTDSVVMMQVDDTISTVALTAKDPAGRVRAAIDQVEVLIQSQQFTEKAVYAPIRLKGKASADSVSVFPQQVLITCVVSLSDYERLSAKDFSVTVDLKQLEAGQQEAVPVTLAEIPGFARNVRVQPRMVDVFIVRQE